MNLPVPVIKSTGPIPAKVMLVGEAPGKEEQMFGVPFIGPSGRELDRMLTSAGFDKTQVYKTNVFHSRPENNDLLNFCGPKSEALPDQPPIKPGKYIRAEFKPEFDRLDEEIKSVSPNIIVALGNVALGALTGHGGIGKNRGTFLQSKQGPKLLATYHPAAVLRNWIYRVIVIKDLVKVFEEQDQPEIVLPSRQILINPNRFQLDQFYDNHIASASEIAVDIETWKGEITMIGFAPKIDYACVVPFIDERRSDFHYWTSVAEETFALNWVRKVLMHPAEKVLQNGSYDLQYVWKKFRCGFNNWTVDTTLAHHALYPEMQKDLGFLGSIYTKEASWKLMRQRSSDVADKKEE